MPKTVQKNNFILIIKSILSGPKMYNYYKAKTYDTTNYPGGNFIAARWKFEECSLLASPQGKCELGVPWAASIAYPKYEALRATINRPKCTDTKRHTPYKNNKKSN